MVSNIMEEDFGDFNKQGMNIILNGMEWGQNPRQWLETVIIHFQLLHGGRGSPTSVHS